MADPFDDIRWKIWRSKQHLDAFHANAKAFAYSGSYRVVMEPDPKTNRLVIVLRDVEQMPPALGLIIGDCANNLRSALDHLMFLLAKPRTETEERNVQFPLSKSKRKFLDNTRHMMPGVARGVRTVVERFQPYHRRKLPKTALLWYLNEITKWDKHRALLTTAAVLEATDLNLRISGTTTVLKVEKFRGMFESGAVLASLEMGYADVGDKVEMNPAITAIPVFDKRMPKPIRGRPVYSTLGKTGEFIENEVLPAFKRFL